MKEEQALIVAKQSVLDWFTETDSFLELEPKYQMLYVRLVWEANELGAIERVDRNLLLCDCTIEDMDVFIENGLLAYETPFYRLPVELSLDMYEVD